MLTVNEIMKILKTQPPDAIVLVSKDVMGSDVSPVIAIETGEFKDGKFILYGQKENAVCICPE